MQTVLPALEKMGNGKPAENWIEARRMYLSTLNNILTPIVYETMYNIHQDAVQFSEVKTNEAVERLFMDYLAEVRVWSINIINGETQAILSQCPWFPTLLKGVFVSSVMVLSSAQLNRANAPAAKVRLNIPTAPTFVQTMYSNVASRFFNNPNLFRSTGLTSDEMIANKNQSYKEIESAIDWTVRSLIPLQQVIESSMNFQGNNPIITAKPNNPSMPPRPRNTVAPNGTNGMTNRVTAKPDMNGPETNAPVVHVPTDETRKQDTRKQDMTKQATKKPSSLLDQQETRVSEKVRSERNALTVEPTKTIGSKTHATSLVGKKETLRPSRISFAPPPPPSLYKTERRPSSRKKESGALRPSNFSKRTDSDAINKVVAQLKLDIPSSSSSSSSSSSTPRKSSSRKSRGRNDLDSFEISYDSDDK